MRIFCETDTTHLYGVDHCVWPGLGVGYLCVYIYSICTNIPYVDDAMLLWGTLFTLDIRNLYKRDISRIDSNRFDALSSLVVKSESESKSECRGTFGKTI